MGTEIKISQQTAAAIIQQVKKIEEDSKLLKKEVNVLKEKLKYMEMILKKNNLIIFGIKKEQYEEVRFVHSITAKLNGYLGLNLQPHEIVYAFRIGNAKDLKQPILLSFVTYWRKLQVMNSAHILPPGIYLREEYPKEVRGPPTAIQPMLKEELRKGNTAYIRGDRLIVKNRTVKQWEEIIFHTSSSLIYSKPPTYYSLSYVVLNHPNPIYAYCGQSFY